MQCSLDGISDVSDKFVRNYRYLLPRNSARDSDHFRKLQGFSGKEDSTSTSTVDYDLSAHGFTVERSVVIPLVSTRILHLVSV